MKAKLLIIILYLISISAFAQNTHILPTPQQVETAEGHFVWDENVVLTYDASDAEINQIITLFRNDLDQISGRKVQFSRGVIQSPTPCGRLSLPPALWWRQCARHGR